MLFVRRTYLSAHCAPLERQIVVDREGYKHLAPLEPEHRWSAILPKFQRQHISCTYIPPV
jgi:hypothetical protein